MTDSALGLLDDMDEDMHEEDLNMNLKFHLTVLTEAEDYLASSNLRKPDVKSATYASDIATRKEILKILLLLMEICEAHSEYLLEHNVEDPAINRRRPTWSQRLDQCLRNALFVVSAIRM